MLAGGVPGSFFLARWDGATWSVPGPGINSTVWGMADLPNGDLVVVGTFSTVGGVNAVGIARWDGVAWSAYGSGLPGNHPSTPGHAYCVTVLPGGELIAGGAFTAAGGVAANRVARWNGAAWSALGSGTDNDVLALTRLANDYVIVGGNFTTANGEPSPYLATLATTCAATAVEVATACVGPAGPMTLTADGLPWAGSTLQSTCTGFAPGSFGAMVLGLGQLNPPVPMQVLHPTGLPNCDLLAPQHAVALALPAGGRATYPWAIPSSATFAGLMVTQQFVQIELSGGSMTSLSSSNSLSLVLGVF